LPARVSCPKPILMSVQVSLSDVPWKVLMHIHSVVSPGCAVEVSNTLSGLNTGLNIGRTEGQHIEMLNDINSCSNLMSNAHALL